MNVKYFSNVNKPLSHLAVFSFLSFMLTPLIYSTLSTSVLINVAQTNHHQLKPYSRNSVHCTSALHPLRADP